MKETSKVYDVMPGEKHLGKVRETTVVYDRDDIIEELINLFENGEVDIEDTFTIGGSDADIGAFLDEQEVDNINEMNNRLLDDDFGTLKHQEMLMTLLDEYVPDNAEFEYDYQEYI